MTTTVHSTPGSSYTASGANTAAPDTSNPTSSASSTPSSSGGLSGGAIAGIVVGAVLGVILFFVFGCFLGRGRKKKTPVELPTSEPRQGGSEKLGWSRHGSLKYGGLKNLFSGGEMESPSNRPRHELPAEEPPHETQSTHRVEM